MRLYLCVMKKVCIVDSVVQHRDDKAKSKLAGLTVGCRVAFRESYSWVTGEGEFMGRLACVEVCTNGVVLFLIHEVAHLLLAQVTLHCGYNRKPCFYGFDNGTTFSAFDRKLK